jgi:hypothetical protein
VVAPQRLPLESITVNQWGKLGRELNVGLQNIREVATAAVEERLTTQEAHEAALAAARAEKEAPGSSADLKRAEALWTLAGGLATVADDYCTRAGYPPGGLRDGGANLQGGGHEHDC